MREHKYKVWDKHKKVFIPTDVWAIVQTGFNAFGIMLKDWEDYKEGEYFYKDSQELIQFTGLRDRNGREIYEGDVVNSEFTSGRYAVVCFGEYRATPADSLATSVGFYFKEKDGYISQFGRTIESNTDAYEVIGNIHENPDLL